jgi:5-methylcytosine-specific restriction enzyme subunit McrC
MSRLFERFILEYYIKEFPEINASAPQIPWALDDGIKTMLPIMQSDITLETKDESKALIIDAKYYSRNTQVRHDTHSIHSANLYQIFSYVKNMAANSNNNYRDVSGLLLYARTEDTVQPDASFQMSGNSISVKTLDLNCDFREISTQLNDIGNFLLEKG